VIDPSNTMYRGGRAHSVAIPSFANRATPIPGRRFTPNFTLALCSRMCSLRPALQSRLEPANDVCNNLLLLWLVEQLVEEPLVHQQLLVTARRALDERVRAAGYH